MKRSAHFALVPVVLMCVAAFSQNHSKRHLYLCRSPLLAFDFWSSLEEVRQKGVAITPAIAKQICNGMKAGTEPQCIRVEAESFKPVATGADGALAMTDGKTKVWFHNPDSGGWIHPAYYVFFVNSHDNPEKP